jgi:hypothetical protein
MYSAAGVGAIEDKPDCLYVKLAAETLPVEIHGIAAVANEEKIRGNAGYQYVLGRYPGRDLTR